MRVSFITMFPICIELLYFVFNCIFFYSSLDAAPFDRPEGTNSPMSKIQGSPKTKYFGVVRIDANKNEFAVEFPMFIIEKLTEVPFVLPNCCVTGGKQVTLRRGFQNEYLAGQFYAFVIKVLYGNESVKALRQMKDAPK